MRQLETLDAYRLARQLAITLYSVANAPPLMRHRSLADQVRRAAISIPANISEGYALATRAQWIRHLRIALGSAAELRTHIQIMQGLVLVPEDTGRDCLAETERLISLIVGLLKGAGARPDPR